MRQLLIEGEEQALFLKADCHFANPDAVAGDVGAVDQYTILKQVHPIVKADIPGAVANFQIDLILPVKGISLGLRISMVQIRVSRSPSS